MVKLKTKVETRSEKLTRLSNKAIDLENDIDYSEHQLYDIVDEIRKMKPTKREIKYRDIQHILDYL